MKDVNEQLEQLQSGTVDVFTEEDLKEKLEESVSEDRPLRIKLGVDPTATDLHLGHYVVFRKLAQFQELGHKVVLIIGDFTARIGDPSDKDDTRPTLSAEEVEENARDYLDQVEHVLDMDKVEVRYNSDWLEPLGLGDVLNLTSHLTVARFMEHEKFRKRFESSRSISLHEFMYPIMQAYDSVAIEADVELGGTDQTFNLLVARDMMKQEGQDPQVAITTPLLVGLDGTRKMSKSLDNHIGIREEPFEMYSQLMSIPDDLMEQYFEFLTEVDEEDYRKLMEFEDNPMEVKKKLAGKVVEDVHGSTDVAQEARQKWMKVFSDRETPDDLRDVNVREFLQEENGEGRLMDLVRFCGFGDSNNEVRRLINQGAVRINDEKMTDPVASVDIEEGDVLRVGKKRRMVRLTLGD
jgi:tyrosyl-tRNA synthetase